MDISVVIPFYNAAPYIEHCIRGLLAQEYPSDAFEILMVDNNSTDGSTEIVRRYPQVNLLHESKQGAYAARNRGLAHARGDLIAFTDPDCVPHVGWLQRLHDAFADTATHVVMGRSLPGGPSEALALLDAYEHHREAYVLASEDATLYYGHTNNMAARRGALDSFGPFEERPRGADTIFVRRTVEGWGCPSVQYEPRAQVDHLEVSDLQTYYRKVFTYGRSRQSYSRIIHARPLRTDERIAVYLRAVRAEHLGAVAAAKLLVLLVLGVGCWYAGALSALRPSQDPAAVPA
jgi:glycosyltransferase involved in cell wall biosynthesis